MPAQSPLVEVTEALRADQERTQQDLRNVGRMLDQSRNEVEKLTQRSATITAQVRQMQANLASVKVTDMKTAYDAALEAQQRMLTMRGQIEKLQSEQNGLNQIADFQRRTLANLEAAGAQGGQVDATAVVVRVVEAQEAERRRLSRQIHDGPAQMLSNFILQAEIAARLFDKDAELARTELANLRQAATSTLQKVRDFIFDLRPMMLDDLGLVPTLKKYTDTFRERSGLQTTFSATGVTDGRFEAAREAVVFRGCQELMANARNHAQATQVNISFDMDSARVRAVVEDNGKGFDPPSVFGKPKATGLVTLKEQIEMLGGQLTVTSHPGEGARVQFDVPLSAE
jgi:two-component system sensor histidine kinase DegS